MYLKSICASFWSELLSKSGYTHVCHYSWNGQLWLHQNECTFPKIHSLSTGGAHSRVEASITSPTSPPYVAKQLTVLFPTQLLCSFLVNAKHSTNNILRILVKAQPSTRSTGPRSPTRLGIRSQDLGLPKISINDSTLASVCNTVIYMVRVWLGLG